VTNIIEVGVTGEAFYKSELLFLVFFGAKKMSNKTEQLINLYTHRIATTDKPCFICNKYTRSVLRTDNGLDWFYTCERYIGDSKNSYL
jgi:hypothetical protein